MSDSGPAALACLKLLNAKLSSNTPGVGFTTSASWDIPSVSSSEIHSDLCDASNGWMDYVLSTKPLPQDLVAELKGFLADKLVSWMELETCIGSFRTFKPVYDHISVRPQFSLVVCTLIFMLECG